MKLVDKENYSAFALCDLGKNGFQSLFKFAAELCARDKRAHIKGKNRLILQPFGYVPTDYSLRESFRNSGLTYTGFAYKHGVVLRLSRKNSYHVTNFGIPADNGVKLLLPCPLDKVKTVFFQSVIRLLRLVVRDARRLYLCKLCLECGFRYASYAEDISYRLRRQIEYRHGNMLDGNVFVPLGFCQLFGIFKHALTVRANIDFVKLGSASADLCYFRYGIVKR